MLKAVNAACHATKVVFFANPLCKAVSDSWLSERSKKHRNITGARTVSSGYRCARVFSYYRPPGTQAQNDWIPIEASLRNFDDTKWVDDSAAYDY